MRAGGGGDARTARLHPLAARRFAVRAGARLLPLSIRGDSGWRRLGDAALYPLGTTTVFVFSLKIKLLQIVCGSRGSWLLDNVCAEFSSNL